MTTEHHRSAWRYLSRRYAGLRWLPLRLALRLGLAVPVDVGPPGPRDRCGRASAQRREPSLRRTAAGGDDGRDATR